MYFHRLTTSLLVRKMQGQRSNLGATHTRSGIGFPGGNFGREDGRGGGGGGTGLPRDCGVAERAGEDGPEGQSSV